MEFIIFLNNTRIRWIHWWCIQILKLNKVGNCVSLPGASGFTDSLSFCTLINCKLGESASLKYYINEGVGGGIISWPGDLVLQSELKTLIKLVYIFLDKSIQRKFPQSNAWIGLAFMGLFSAADSSTIVASVR